MIYLVPMAMFEPGLHQEENTGARMKVPSYHPYHFHTSYLYLI